MCSTRRPRGKTRVLHALAAQGEQVLDLEGLARHKGSLLGALPDIAQPSQTAFETALADVIERVDLARPLYVEGESARIGKLNLPVALVAHMRDSACVEIDASPETRLVFLLHDYAYLGDRPAWLADQLGRLKELHGKTTIAAWQEMATTGNLRQLFGELATEHYDPSYARSQRKHFHKWEARRVVHADSLSAQGIESLATSIAQTVAEQQPA